MPPASDAAAAAAQRHARKRTPRAMWRGKWLRLARRGVDDGVAHVRERALGQCTAEFDFGMRHRLLARTPRALCRPFGKGVYDTSYPVLYGRRADTIDNVATSAGEDQIVHLKDRRRRRGDAVGHSYTYVLADTVNNVGDVAGVYLREETNPHSKKGVVSKHIASYTYYDMQTIGDAMNYRAGILYRFPAKRCPLFQLRALEGQEHYHSVHKTRVNFKVVGVGSSDQWPGSTVVHQNVFSIVRGPAYGRLAHALENVRKHGFVNYYALPTRKEPSPEVLAVMPAFEKNYEQLLDGMLHELERARRHEEIAALRKAWRKGQLTVQMVNDLLVGQNPDEWTFKSREYTILYNLAIGRKPHDVFLHTGVIAGIPRLHVAFKQLRHLMWNYMASMRLSIYGLRPVVGDVARVRGNVDGPSAYTYVTDDNIHNFTIYDVVLPLFTLDGLDELRVPRHDAGWDVWHTVLVDYAVDLEEVIHDKEVHDIWRGAFLGQPNLERYRPLLARPKHLTWKVLDSDEELLPHLHCTLRDTDSAPVPRAGGQRKLIINAELPMTSDVPSMLREAIMAPAPLSGIPETWAITGFRPGAMIEADDDIPMDLSEEDMRLAEQLVEQGMDQSELAKYA